MAAELGEPDRPSRLAGRQAELAAALEAMGRSRQEQRMQVVELVGEPGMGKTRLLKEIANRARLEHWRVAVGQPAEFGSPADQCQLVDALDDHVTPDEVQSLDKTQPGAAALLATIFPALALHRGPQAAMTPVEHYWFMRAFRSLLIILADGSGLVLLLDDVHRSDGLTMAALGYLLRHPPQVPLLLATAYRPRRVNSRLVRAQLAAVRDGLSRRIVLPPLTAQEAQTLLHPRMRRWQRELTYRRSGGNPTYLEILNATSTSDGHPGAADELPPLLAAHLLADLQALSPGGRLVAGAAAVAGDPFDPMLVASIAEMARADTLRGIDEMLQNDLIEPVDASPRFRFRHPLVRQVAYDAASAGWRLGAHTRAAAILCQRRAPLVALAHHIGRAAAPGDSASRDVLLYAARSIVRTEPLQAAEWLESALQLLGEDADEHDRRLEILELLAAAQLAGGRLPQARQTYDQLLAENPPRRSALLVTATEVDLLPGRIGAARDRLSAELTSRAHLADAEPASLLLVRSTVTLHDEVPDLELVRQSAQAIDAWAPSPMRAQAHAGLAVAIHAAGDTGAPAHADAAADLVDRLPDGELAAHPWALIWLARAENDLERYELARRHAHRGMAILRATPSAHLLPYLLTCSIEADLRQGRLADAGVSAAQLEDVLGTAGQAGPLAGVHLLAHSRIAAESGDAAGALIAARRCVESMVTVQGELAREGGLALARALISAGRWGLAVQTFLSAGGGANLSALRVPTRVAAYTDLVRAELAAGRPLAARGWLERARNLNPPDLPGLMGRLQLARARTLFRADPQQCAAEARHAAELFTKSGRRLDAGRALLLASMAMERGGSAITARDLRAEAVALLTDCGARQSIGAAHAEHGLTVAHVTQPAPRPLYDAKWAHAEPPVAMPVHPHGETEPGQDETGFTALSGRELQIAELVSRGHTNRQIARMLSLSHKTVETYLARIFTKLGVSSRAAVATLVGRGVLSAGDIPAPDHWANP
jgi:ATP/maltotriose-dependent transcriptional regulator MalT